jgi:hypothetical protein
MRTTEAAEPRPFAWQLGFNLTTYAAQPFPPVAWKQVPSNNALKWCEAVHLTWIAKKDCER